MSRPTASLLRPKENICDSFFRQTVTCAASRHYAAIYRQHIELSREIRAHAHNYMRRKCAAELPTPARRHCCRSGVRWNGRPSAMRASWPPRRAADPPAGDPPGDARPVSSRSSSYPGPYHSDRPPSSAISLGLPFMQRVLPFLVVSDSATVADRAFATPCCTEVVGRVKPNDQRWKRSCRRLVGSHSNGGLHYYGSAEV